MRRIDIVGAQQAQLFPAQRGIVGQGQHHTVADPLIPGRSNEFLPLLVGGDPSQLAQPRDQAPLVRAASMSRGCVAARPTGLASRSPSSIRKS